MTEQHPPPAVTASCTNRYGIHLLQLGEEGEVLVLGHHEDKRRLVAALNAEHRFTYGNRMATELDPGDMVADVVDQLSERWAVIALPCGAEERNHVDPDCAGCRQEALENPDGEWFVCWGQSGADPDAFPITVFGGWA